MQVRDIFPLQSNIRLPHLDTPRMTTLLTFPVGYSLVPQMDFVFPSPSIVIHELIPKHLACDATGSRHSCRCRFQRRRQHDDLSAHGICQTETRCTYLAGLASFFLDGSLRYVLIGGLVNSISFSMPLKPNLKMALSTKYGFISAPGTRTSKRVAAGGTEGGDIMRTEAARES